jgi:PadR family transcriptional regulator, regulatory protein PadR
VLLTLSERHPAWTHGYDLSKVTGLKSGTLYPILRRLNEQELLEARWEESEHVGRPPRHSYQLSNKGLQLIHVLNASPALSLKGILI